jgi:hypothetical protein
MTTRRKELKRIESANDRQSTFCKRKRGLLKKCIEISELCGVFVHLVIFD